MYISKTQKPYPTHYFSYLQISGFTQVVSLHTCDLFLVILVTHIKYLAYCKIVPDSFDLAV